MGDIRLVLLIDGTKAAASQTFDALHAIGVREIKHINSLYEAKEFLSKNKVVMIVIDSYIGQESSIPFIKELRADFKNANYRVPIIFTMGVPTLEDVKNARDAGITEMIAKPLNLEALKSIILNTLKFPRNFIISRGYVGPDRRRREGAPPDGAERRVQIIEEPKKD